MNIEQVKKLIKETWVDPQAAILNEENPNVKEKIHKLNQLNFTLKKMSTAHMGLLINLVCSQLSKDECYLNIGVWNGYSFFAGVLDNECQAIANDAFQVYTGKTGWTGSEDRLGRDFGDTQKIFTTEFKRICSNKQKYIIKDCWEFLDEYNLNDFSKVGFYFYDGNHSYDDQLRALQKIEPFLADECIIMIDDANDDPVQSANRDYFSKHPAFEKILDIKTPSNGWPTWWNGVELYGRLKA